MILEHDKDATGFRVFQVVGFLEDVFSTKWKGRGLGEYRP